MPWHLKELTPQKDPRSPVETPRWAVYDGPPIRAGRHIAIVYGRGITEDIMQTAGAKAANTIKAAPSMQAALEAIESLDLPGMKRMVPPAVQRHFDEIAGWVEAALAEAEGRSS